MSERTLSDNLSKKFDNEIKKYARMHRFWQVCFFVALLGALGASFYSIDHQNNLIEKKIGQAFIEIRQTFMELSSSLKFVSGTEPTTDIGEDVSGAEEDVSGAEISYIDLAATFIPMYVFFAWLLGYIGNRRAESAKIEEIYKHKKIMVEIFLVYKETVEALGDKSLLIKHTENLLEAIKKDPSDALSPKGERHPVTNIFRRDKSPSSD